ncbi:unnamed protein product [Mycena citricolor]|uniref:Uncharacterized protein n=1 Tax=Mycena citricolor TaxID=2018698 RepID=A0AAD2HLX5_9AGAR|nr:unnamed protein product [Mycena citricolor]
MPRENSFSDDGRSLTPDLEIEGEPASPKYDISSSSSRLGKHGTGFSSSAPPPAPLDRFRGIARKVIAMHRSTSVLSPGSPVSQFHHQNQHQHRSVGAEPGIDPRRASAQAQYGHIQEDCVIEVVDYSVARTSFGRMTNREFVRYMADDGACARESWVKVRWINIGGISWDVVKALAERYELHPLALEDVFVTRSQTRSKADYYVKHLFLRILCHELVDDSSPSSSASAAQGSTLTDLPRSDSPIPFTDADDELEMKELGKGDFGPDAPTLRNPSMRRRSRKRNPLLPTSRKDTHLTSPKSRLSNLSAIRHDNAEQRTSEEAALRALKGGTERVNVKVSPMFVFLFRDGTVISMHSAPSVDLTLPITRRLRQRDTGLRSSADSSLLVQGLVDLIVDKGLEVIDAYHVKIRKFEREILLKPKMSTVRNLHILSGDLILHKRTLEPIKTVIYGLRRYDDERAAALVTEITPGGEKVKGFMSHKSKIYLADVHDHMEYILTSLEMFAGIGENLIGYTFNMASYEMNEVMRRLTLATIIFLPLTLLTGYFGMNFKVMWSLAGHSDLFFWIVALPVMAIVIPLCISQDIIRVLHYARKHLFKW